MAQIIPVNINSAEKTTPYKVFIACFGYGGSIPIDTAKSLFASIVDLNSNGIETDLDLRGGGPYVMKERNISLMRFLASNATHMIFIDADLAFRHDSIRKLMTKAIEKDIHLMGALYRYKMDQEAYPCQLYTADDGSYYEEDGLYRAAGIPTGMMLISRHCAETLIEEYPETRFELRDSGSKTVAMTLYDLFDGLLFNGQWWGEDYVFCRRWTALGGQIWVYPDIDVAHIGMKPWAGNFSKWVAANEKAIADEIQAEKEDAHGIAAHS